MKKTIFKNRLLQFQSKDIEMQYEMSLISSMKQKKMIVIFLIFKNMIDFLFNVFVVKNTVTAIYRGLCFILIIGDIILTHRKRVKES